MSDSEPTTVEFRPDLDEYRDLLRPRLKFLIPLAILAAFRATQSPLTGILVVGGLGLFAIVGIIHIRTSRILLTPTTVEHRGLVVRDRVIGIDDARGILGVMTQSLSSDVTTLVVQSRSTGRSLRVFGGLWNPAQLTAVAEHSGAELVPQPMSGTAMNKYVPGAIPFRYRRPLTFALGVFVVMVAGVIALAIAVT